MAHTIVQPDTMMIELTCAAVASVAVLCVLTNMGVALLAKVLKLRVIELLPS